MSVAGTSAPEILVAPRAEAPSLVSQYLQLTKARLSALVLLTTGVGFLLAVPGVDWWSLIWTILGTGLAAGCANALNQILEMRRDARMLRTRGRPLPSGVLSPRHGYIAAVIMGYLGVSILAVLVNLLAAGLALLTIVVYVAIYTPLKPRTSLNTLVGAACGAIPPVIGWAAASGGVERGAWLLAAILFLWQLPHFFALAWLYREDYERGGFRMLPVLDRRGEVTCQVIVLTSLMLIPLALTAVLLGLAGPLYAVGSVVVAAPMVALSIVLYRRRTDGNARRVFLASLVYLPLVLALLVVDHRPVATETSLTVELVPAAIVAQTRD